MEKEQQQQQQELFSPSLTNKIEAILYLKAQPIPIKELVSLTSCSFEQIQTALIELMSDYAYRNSALEITETPHGYCLQLRTDYQSLLENLVPAELTNSTLKTLAAIALQQPILQSDLILLRGSSAYQHVSELTDSGFIRKRRQEEGRSYWLEVTSKFHQYFEIDKLAQ